MSGASSPDGANNLQGVDNLTPFEYALAGVSPPDGHDSPSLAVIEEMRRLAADVLEAPVSQPRLREFLETGGSIALHNDRRAPWRRGSGTGETNGVRSSRPVGPVRGSFVDITPAELAGGADTAPDTTAEHPAVGPPAAQTPVDDAGPMTQPVDQGRTAADAAPSDLDGADGIDLLHTALRDVLGDGAPDDRDRHYAPPPADGPTPPAAPEIAAPARPVTEETTEAIEAAVAGGGEPVEARPGPAVADGEPAEPLADETVEAIVSAALLLSEPLGQSGDRAEPVDGAVEDDAVGDQGPRPPAEPEPAVAESPRLFPDVSDSPDLLRDGRRDLAGRFARPGAGSPAAEPVLAGADRAGDDGRPAALPAAAGSRALLAEEYDPDAVPLAAVTPVDLGLPLASRRPGAAVLALAGAAAAAAVLALGGLWWASNLSGSPDTEAAATDPDAPGDGGGRVEAGSAAGDNDEAGSRPDEFEPDGATTPTTGTTMTAGTPERGAATTRAGTSSTGERSTEPSPATRETVTTGDTPTTSVGTATTQGRTGPGVSTPAPSAAAVEPGTTRAPAGAAPQSASIGGSVRVGSARGPGLGGVGVQLLRDTNGDRAGDQLVSSQTTSAAGRYAFDSPAGCYEIRFQAPDGYRIDEGQDQQRLCLDPGRSSTTIDAVVQEIAPPDPPSGCLVEGPGDEYWRGVEVFENDSNWAESYTFYDKSGRVVVRTADMGPADDIEGPTNREWHAAANGFDHRLVRSVAAVRGGVESPPVSCQRD